MKGQGRGRHGNQRRNSGSLTPERAAAMWANADQEKRTRMRGKKITSETAKSRWQDPTFRNKQIAILKARAKDPEYKRRIAEKIRALWADPVYRANQVNKRLGRPSSIKQKETAKVTIRSQAAQEGRDRAWNDPETRQRMLDALARGRITAQANMPNDHVGWSSLRLKRLLKKIERLEHESEKPST